LDNGTRHPNLALMKISGYLKNNNYDTELLFNYDDVSKFEKIFLSKVFTFTNIEIDLKKYPNIKYGGTGFFLENAENLPDNIEHHMPDYHLYDRFIGREIARGIKLKHFTDYQDYSIGFTTRGCFRKCEFCVNKKYDKVFKHSNLNEFFDPKRKNIYLWDDNFLGYHKWNEILDELEETGKYFQFRQGLDLRLMTDEKAKRFSKVKYKGDFIFAFDHLEDKKLIEEKLKLWRKHTSKTTKLYVLCAYDSTDVNDIISIFERIKIIMKYKCLPYIMRFDGWKQSDTRGMYINISRWANQPDFFKKKTFREFCEANQNINSEEKCATMKYLEKFEKEYPDIAKKYFNLRFDDLKIY
ncbi:MAG: radical SAM protein, partial [Candidatus Humimicrobiaceae bacterium]